MPSFEDLLAEGEAVPTEGWDFSWFAGRATEARPSWGYATSLATRLPHTRDLLDIDTGGGEVLAFALDHADGRPRRTVATEAWPPNARKAAALLAPRHATVVQAQAPYPFRPASFDLITSRHPVTPHWPELARLLTPGGTYFAQHVGYRSAFELVEWFLGPQPPDVSHDRHPETERAAAENAGLDVVGLRAERLRMEFHDIAAVVHFLRKVVWMVPGFTVARHRPQLLRLHERIEADGPFVAHSSRHLIEARRPPG